MSEYLGIEMGEGLGIGIHDISPELYHSDCCPEPSLTSSGIKRLLSGSPAEFAAYHPRLTAWPHLLEDRTKAKDLGNIVHSIVLGRGCSFIAKDPSDFLTKKGAPAKTWGAGEAAAWKEEQEANGVIVLNGVDGASVQAAADSMMELLRKEYGDWPIGDSERTLIWQRETSFGPIWCRARLDHLALQHMLVLDPKATDLPIHNRALQKKAAAELWHIQAAWYMEGVEACYPSTYGRIETVDIDEEDSYERREIAGLLSFRFPVVEINPPYQSRFVDLSEAWIHIGRQRCDRAAETFARCLHAQRWPDYDSAYSPEPPSWMLSEFEEEELRA